MKTTNSSKTMANTQTDAAKARKESEAHVARVKAVAKLNEEKVTVGVIGLHDESCRKNLSENLVEYLAKYILAYKAENPNSERFSSKEYDLTGTNKSKRVTKRSIKSSTTTTTEIVFGDDNPQEDDQQSEEEEEKEKEKLKHNEKVCNQSLEDGDYAENDDLDDLDDICFPSNNFDVRVEDSTTAFSNNFSMKLEMKNNEKDIPQNKVAEEDNYRDKNVKTSNSQINKLNLGNITDLKQGSFENAAFTFNTKGIGTLSSQQRTPLTLTSPLSSLNNQTKLPNLNLKNMVSKQLNYILVCG